jgi:hypothetical protein
MTTQRTISQILLEDHSISIRPGAKGECPSCHLKYFSLKGDDSLGKCFHPPCGYFLTIGQDNGQYRHSVSRVLTAVYHDFHQELLHLASGHQNAYTYLQNERGIHPQVIADAMLGAMPSGYDVTPHFQPILTEAQAAITALQGQKRGRPTKQLEQAEKRLQDLQAAQQKLVDCLAHRAGWLVFFYTDAAHRPVALRLREAYTRHFVSFKPGIAGVFGRELFTPRVRSSPGGNGRGRARGARQRPCPQFLRSVAPSCVAPGPARASPVSGAMCTTARAAAVGCMVAARLVPRQRRGNTVPR